MTTEAQHKPNAFSLTADAMKLADHVITITDNMTKFNDYATRRSKNPDGTVTEIVIQREDSLSNIVRRQAVTIYIKCCQSNSIDLSKEPGRKEERLRLQREAAELCRDHLIMIQLCAKHFHLANSKVKYWGTMTRDLMLGIARWHKSDKDRYKNI